MVRNGNGASRARTAAARMVSGSLGTALRPASARWRSFLIPGLLLVMVVGAAGAETIRQSEFRVRNPEIFGQGGSYVAVAEGYSSLFTNPAGIARGSEPEITIPAMTFWVHSRPDLILSTIGAFGGDEIDSTGADGQTREALIIDTLSEQFTTNGFGLGFDLGIGYTGNRIGVGLSVALDSYLYGQTFPLGLEGEIQQRLGLVFAYAQPLELGPVSLSLGGAVRPTLRIASFVDSDTAATLIGTFTGIDTGQNGGSPLETLRALNGWGVAFDAGLIAEYHPFAMGLQVRNLFNTNMAYANNTLQEVINALSQGGLPPTPREGDDAFVADTYIIPAEMSVGLAWQPDTGAWSSIVDPELHMQLTDPFGWADIDRSRPRSFWTRVHVGTEVTLLRFFDLRFGLNQGYFTVGSGVRLAFLDLQFALFSEEYGRYPGDQQVGGFALEMAVRF